MSAEQELKVVAYRVDWPAEIGIAPDRFYGADDTHRMNCHLSYVHGVAAPIVVPLVRLTDAQSVLESERQAHAAEIAGLRADAEHFQRLFKATKLGHEQMFAQCQTLSALLRRSLVQLGQWQRKYGEHNPSWLPPAGDVELAEDIDQAIARGKT